MTRAAIVRAAALLALAAPALVPAMAQSSINLRDADIRAFIDDVARTTGASFVIDPRVEGKVSVVSERPLSRTQYFELFLATLQANGYAAVPLGQGQYRIQPAEAGAAARGGRFTTAVINLSNTDAQSAIDSLRPVLSRSGTVTANRTGNAVIVADFADNIARARQVLAEIDRDRSVTEVVPLHNSGARDLTDSLRALVHQPGESSAVRLSIVPIDASNAIALRGAPDQVRRIARLARDLDTRAAGGSESRVIFLQNADAGAIMPVLQQLVGQAPTPQGGATTAPALAGTPFGRRDAGSNEAPARESTSIGEASVGVAAGGRGKAIIARYEGANALVIAAPPEVQKELSEIIRQLDTRRAQVHVEAIIVEISDSAAKELGVQFMLSGKGGTVPLMSSNFSNAAPNLMAITGAIAADKGLISDGEAAGRFRQAAVDSLLGTNGLTAGVARIAGDTLFGFVANALRNDANSNILSTPSLMTLDNQPARILVGQEIPVTTGEALGNNLDNSFRTVDRQDVGVQLSVKPQINAGGTVTLAIKQIVSSVASTIDARDFVLNKRELETSVTVGDGQILALGGLLEDSEHRSVQKIPLLGDVPVVGNLFRSTSRKREKTNLMIFIRPTVVRTAAAADEVTAARWQTAREMQTGRYGSSSLDALALDYLRTPPPVPLPPASPTPPPAPASPPAP